MFEKNAWFGVKDCDEMIFDSLHRIEILAN